MAIVLTDEQKFVIQQALQHTWSVKIHGAPGVSKSFVVQRIVNCRIDPEHNTQQLLQSTIILCAAPTAKVAEDSCVCFAPCLPLVHNQPCFTMDGLLLRSDIWKQIAEAIRNKQVLQFWVCLDEALMLSAYHFEELCRKLQIATKNLGMIKFCVTGDMDQLQAPCALSICKSPSYQKLLTQNTHPTLILELTEQLRFKDSPDMLQLAQLLRKVTIDRTKLCWNTIDRIVLMLNERTVRPGLQLPKMALHNKVTCIRSTNKEANAINAKAVTELHKVHKCLKYIVVDSTGNIEFLAGQHVMLAENQKVRVDGNLKIVGANGSVWILEAVLGDVEPNLRGLNQLHVRTVSKNKNLQFVLRHPSADTELTVSARLSKKEDAVKSKYTIAVKHCWAITAHCSQGMTMRGCVHVKFQGMPSIYALVVAATRCTHWENFFCDGFSADEFAELLCKKEDVDVAKVKRYLSKRTTFFADV